MKNLRYSLLGGLATLAFAAGCGESERVEYSTYAHKDTFGTPCDVYEADTNTYDACIEGLAVKSTNASLCDFITDDCTAFDCKIKVAVSATSPEHCDQFKDSQPLTEICKGALPNQNGRIIIVASGCLNVEGPRYGN
ncbi:hypothetical protein J4216_00915 [Candidatus Woesearchaeota archaeon]|nr:hypothetical protein [Candidatus Woesearchaeota archaeon]